MTETFGFLLVVFICLYFDKREELKREKKKRLGPNLFEELSGEE